MKFLLVAALSALAVAQPPPARGNIVDIISNGAYFACALADVTKL